MLGSQRVAFILQCSKGVTNVHYHANSSCPLFRFADFIPSNVQVPKEVEPKLTPEHWLFLLQAFGIVC